MGRVRNERQTEYLGFRNTGTRSHRLLRRFEANGFAPLCQDRQCIPRKTLSGRMLLTTIPVWSVLGLSSQRGGGLCSSWRRRSNARISWRLPHRNWQDRGRSLDSYSRAAARREKGAGRACSLEEQRFRFGCLEIR